MKQSAKKILSITLTAVLLFCSFQAPIPSFGPRLSDAATELVATQTDVTLQPIPGADEVPAMSTTGTQVKNIRVAAYIETETPFVYAGGMVEKTYVLTDLTLLSYDCGVLSPQDATEYILDDWESGRTMYITLDEPGQTAINYSAGDCVFNMYFNAPMDQATPLNGLSCTSDGAMFADYTTNVGGFTVCAAYLGDPTGDGVVNATDMLRVMQFSAGNFTPTPAQRLASDVNMDGVIDATDGMYVGQYAEGELKTFFGNKVTQVPTATDSTIGTEKVVRIQNVSSSRYLSYDSNNSTVEMVASSAYDPTTTTAKFRLIASTNGKYFIREVTTNLLMSLDANGNPTFSTTAYLSGSRSWYIIPTGTNYKIVNSVYVQKPLADFRHTSINTDATCGVTYMNADNVWTLHGPSVTINYYYDNGYYSRYSTDGVSDINDYQGQISTILSNVFGVDVTLGAAGSAPTTSLADGCTASVGSLCSDSGRTNATCIANCETSPYTNVHHKNANALLLSWYDSMTTAQRGKIHVMFSGHAQCYVNDDGEHKTNTLNGVTYINRRVAVVYSNGIGTREYKEKLTALHEISHDLGAFEENGALVDDNHSQEPEDINCIMSYNRENEILTGWFNGSNAANHRALYCDDCYDHIVDYLNKYY